MLKIENLGEHKWCFIYPLKYECLLDKFYKGIEVWETGDIKSAKKIYQEIIRELPEFIDAYHHLALLYEEIGNLQLALENWVKGYQIGMQALSEGFTPGRDLLEWSFLENRPFLRCTHSLGLYFFERGYFAKGLELFEFIISINPNDNQGIRALLVDGYLKIGNYAGALDVCNNYQNDIMVEVLYGRPYALFKLGEKAKATQFLKDAIQLRPKVAKELLKKKHVRPKSILPGRYTVGGDDEAYFYWETNNILWEVPEMKEWLIKNAT